MPQLQRRDLPEITHMISKFPTLLFPTVTCCLAETSKISRYHILCSVLLCRSTNGLLQPGSVLNCRPGSMELGRSVICTPFSFKQCVCVYLGLWLLLWKLTMLDCWLMRTHIINSTIMYLLQESVKNDIIYVHDKLFCS